jgi:hypothetical protein
MGALLWIVGTTSPWRDVPETLEIVVASISILHFGRIEQYLRVATNNEKLPSSYSAFVASFI